MDKQIILAPTYTSKWCRGATYENEQLTEAHWFDTANTETRWLSKRKICNVCHLIGRRYSWSQKRIGDIRQTNGAYSRSEAYRLRVLIIGRAFPELAALRNSNNLRWGGIYRKYGVTKIQWVATFIRQGYACAICRTTDPGKSGQWHTDHDHSTGEFRGILCSRCNQGLVALDRPGWLDAAQRYLKIAS